MPLPRAVWNLPWQALYQGTYAFRRAVFGREPDPVDHVVVEGAGPADLERLFFSQGLVMGDYASYYYYDEDLNMVRGMYKDDEYEWYQYHVRGFEVDGGVRLRPHTELYWRVYPREHMRLVNLDVAEGIEVTRDILDGASVPYEVVPRERHPSYVDARQDARESGTTRA